METANKILSSDIQTLRNPESSTSTYLDIDRALAEIVDFVKTDDFNKLNDSEISELRNNHKRLVNLKFDVLHPSINLDDVKELKTFSDSVNSMLGIENKTNYSVRFTELQESTFSEINKYYTEKEKNAVNDSSGNYDLFKFTSEERKLINEMFPNNPEKIEAIEFMVANFLPGNNKPVKFKYIHNFLVSKFAHSIHKESYIEFVKSRFNVNGHITPDLQVKSKKYQTDLERFYSNYKDTNRK